MKNIQADIKNRSFKRVYLLYGEEEYLKNQYKNMLFDAVRNEDTMNTLVLDGKDADLIKVRDFSQDHPFFADYRTILLSETGLFSKSSEDWAKLVDELWETVVLIFVESKVDKRNKLYKTVRDKGYACEINKPDEATLKKWIGSILKKNGKVIRESTCEALLMRVGDNMDNLRTQLDKIISYAADHEEIEVSDVDAVCSPEPQNQVFKMIDLAIEGRTDMALSIYYDLLALREPSMRTLFNIGRHLNQLLLAKELMADGMSSGNIASKIGVMPFIASKIVRQAKEYSKKQLLEYVSLCVHNEELVKTGRMDEKIAVETIIVRLCSRT